MQRSTDRIVTTHVGALPRPRDLEDALVDQPHRPEAFADLLPDSVDAVVEQQRDAGIDVVNDGEMGKPTWDWYVMDRLSGFEYRPDRVDKALDGQDQRELPRVLRAGRGERALVRHNRRSRGGVCLANSGVHRADRLRPHPGAA